MNVSNLGGRAKEMAKMHADEAPPTLEQVSEEHNADVEAVLAPKQNTMVGQLEMLQQAMQMPGSRHVERPGYADASVTVTSRALQSAGFTESISGHDDSVRAAQVRAEQADAKATALAGNMFDPNALGAALIARAAHMQVAVATTREAEHVGLLSALDLPTSYRIEAGEYFSVRSDDPSAQAFAAKLKANPSALATLQAEADLGMEAAREMTERGGTTESLLQENPSFAKLYAADPAFRAGFDGYVYAATHSPDDLTAIHQRLDQESIANHAALARMSFPV